jgi:hypothetical protein
MSKRLQVLIDEEEYQEIARIAEQRRMTISEWARQALRAARRREPVQDAGRKLAAVRAAARHQFPTADLQSMLDEIERGYRGGGA